MWAVGQSHLILLLQQTHQVAQNLQELAHLLQ
jgi:hypothetical protein